MDIGVLGLFGPFGGLQRKNVKNGTFGPKNDLKNGSIWAATKWSRFLAVFRGKWMGKVDFLTFSGYTNLLAGAF